ncbi:PREDICTED: mediator of DNA damage checkpoint protein 1 isoform X7 [Trachymyrmex cornetzi]|uniref:mediator of DNA damage checkpoint protein 1 isoform X7 n=1 Tax=Trachymyrmex cornetzi TaxID=471704 RepID=UPI00084F3BF9|nr:PREDICTED: mediator of DNA damage checkpoint protein 1 isoform X7 [Trachymyrmex cornetzi]
MMPANKSNLSTPRKEKPGDKLYTLATSVAANANKKKKRSSSFVKHKHYAQYLQLHSEYRSTYTWHEYTGPHQEHTVVRRAPQPPPSTKQPSAKLQSAKSTEDENSEGPTLEPPLPRRKKCPELAYRTHEFITAADGGGIDAIDSNVVADKVREVTATSALPPSQLSKAISRISTEYRLQFAWPRRPQLTNGETQAPVPAAGVPGGTTGPPRKSLSMGALKQGMVPSGPAPVHKKRPGDFDHKRDGVQASELEPLVGGIGTDMIDGVVPEGDEREEDLSDLKVAFRSVTKEEKEKENTRKVAPITTMPPAGRPSSVQARPIHGIIQDDTKADTDRAIARARKDFLIRHHLDRTTGVGDGALLPSPTREKLEPVIPRRRDDVKEHRDEIQPRTKSSPKNSPRTGRSQSLGPTVTDRRSPKRQPPRAPSVTKDAKEKEKEMKDKDKEHREKSGEPERHPRPMTAEPQVNGDVTGGDSSVASTPPSQTTKVVGPAPVTQASPWLDDEPVVKSPPEPTRVKSPEQMIMRSPEPVNWTVPLDTGKTFTVTQNVREEPLTRPHSEAKTWAPSSVPSAPQSAPPELAAQHKSQHSQHSGYKSPESESVSLGSFSGINGHKDLDSERDSPLPTNAQDTPKDEKEITIVEETKERQSPESIKSMTGTNLRRLEDPTFEIESKKEGGIPVAITTAPVTTTSSTSPAPQSYRVLEAESSAQGTGGSSSSTVGTGSSTGGSTASGYHVLEAPTVVPGSAQRSAATDVLEKARNRFDKFWGKGNNGAEN